jgi:hypothetical protein
MYFAIVASIFADDNDISKSISREEQSRAEQRTVNNCAEWYREA